MASLKSKMNTQNSTPLLKVMGVSLTLTLGLLVAPGAAANNFSSGFDAASGGLVQATYGHRSSRYSQRFHRSNRYSRSNRGSFNNRFRRSSSRFNSGRNCQRVSRWSYWNNRHALVGGRACVNSRGYSYIVPNSRYLIRYR